MAKGQTSSFGGQSRDGNGETINVANAFVTKDISATPKVSPLTVSTTVLTLAIPDNVTQIIFYATANDCRISEESTAAANYFVLKAGQMITVDVAKLSSLFLLRDAAADVTLQFLMKTI